MLTERGKSYNFNIAAVLSGTEELRPGSVAAAGPTAARAGQASVGPAGGGPKRLRRAGDRRNDGGFDGRRRLTEQSPTATAEPGGLKESGRSGRPPADG